MLIHQAIFTKFLGPIDTKNSRVKATAAAGSITLPWNHAMNPHQNHRAAAYALAKKFNWSGSFYARAISDSEYAFVYVDNRCDYDNSAIFSIQK